MTEDRKKIFVHQPVLLIRSNFYDSFKEEIKSDQFTDLMSKLVFTIDIFYSQYLNWSRQGLSSRAGEETPDPNLVFMTAKRQLHKVI